jgi:hypothetical protein
VHLGVDFLGPAEPLDFLIDHAKLVVPFHTLLLAASEF